MDLGIPAGVSQDSIAYVRFGGVLHSLAKGCFVVQLFFFHVRIWNGRDKIEWAVVQIVRLSNPQQPYLENHCLLANLRLSISVLHHKISKSEPRIIAKLPLH